MTSIRTEIGDVFVAELDATKKKYFQYVASDLSQLNSDVIRVFDRTYPSTADPDLSKVVEGEVEFYAHCVIKWGIKMGLWKRVGNVVDVGSTDILFRNTNDYGSRPAEQIQVSNNWHVWRVNEDFRRVGKLEGNNRRAEIGIVISPPNILHRMRTGKYQFTYPDFE